jgi:hypothetical protein
MGAPALTSKALAGAPVTVVRRLGVALDTITRLRRLVDEPDETTYSDEEMQERLDSASGINSAARDIWAEKLAAASALVNMSEGGSSRSQSQAYDHAKEMFHLYTSLADSEGGASAGSPVLRRIVRA